MTTPIELIQSLIEQAEVLQYAQKSELDVVRRRSEMIIRKIFGEDRHYMNKLKTLQFIPFLKSLI